MHTDICIIGASMVGLSLANQITERFPNLSITPISLSEESILNFTILFSKSYWIADM